MTGEASLYRISVQWIRLVLLGLVIRRKMPPRGQLPCLVAEEMHDARTG